MTTPDGATTVKLFLDAVQAGDVETAMSYVDDDVEMNTAEHHPFLPGPYRGHQGFLQIMAKIGEVLDGFRLDVQRVLGCGDAAVTQLRYSARSSRPDAVLTCRQRSSGTCATGR